MKHFILPLFSTVLLTGVSSCAVTTAGIKKGDERNFARSLNDVNAGRAIKARMTRAYDFTLKGVDVEVAEGVVLLSGNVPSKEDRIEAARIAWSAPRIDQVGNEIFIKDKQSFSRNTKDGLLEKTVRARLIAEKNVKSRNLNIETHDGIVYLMGVARTAGELELAAKIAAETRGTREVISYVRIADMSQMARLDAADEQNYAQGGEALGYQDNYQSYDPYPQAEGQQRAVPGFLSTTPPAAQQPMAPIQNVPLGQPIPLNRNTPQDQASGPTAPAQLNMGDRMNKEFPTDEELGAYRTGQVGETISEIQSEPYYIDPDTGEQIPVSFKDGVVYPRLIK